MIKYSFLLFLVVVMTCTLAGQSLPTIPENRDSNISTNSSTEPDSTKIVGNTFFDIFNGKPGKAAFYGLIVPGGGQIYNRKWWKLPLVYGLEGFLIYRIISTTSLYNGYQDAYLRNLNGDPFVYRGTSDVSILKRRRDSIRQAREYSYVFFIGGHLIVLFEAFIDRHLMEFDISDDLTFTPIVTDIGVFNGLTYTIPLNKQRKIEFKNLLE